MIQDILNAKSYYSLLKGNDEDSFYKNVMKQIHPDTCTDPQAGAAAAKLNQLRTIWKEGIEVHNDSGNFVLRDFSCVFTEKTKENYDGYEIVLNLCGDSVFSEYIPKEATLESNKLTFTWPYKVIPLSQEFGQLHVNWIINRILEFSVFLHGKGYCLSGITPESFFITPERHGIVFNNFYHLKRIGETLSTISGKYQNWYYPDIFTEKRAMALNDLFMIKRLAFYLLGDSSAQGISLLRNKNVNSDYVKWIINHPPPTDSKDFLVGYKEMLSKTFEKKFVNMEF